MCFCMISTLLAPSPPCNADVSGVPSIIEPSFPPVSDLQLLIVWPHQTPPFLKKQNIQLHRPPSDRDEIEPIWNPAVSIDSPQHVVAGRRKTPPRSAKMSSSADDALRRLSPPVDAEANTVSATTNTLEGDAHGIEGMQEDAKTREGIGEESVLEKSPRAASVPIGDDVPGATETCRRSPPAETLPAPTSASPPPSPNLSNQVPMPLEFSTPQQRVQNMRLAVEAHPLLFPAPPSPSPVVEPGALHELGDPGVPGRRRSSANAGIAGLEELRREKIGQLIHATSADEQEDSEVRHTIDAFIKLNFDDGNVYYVKNSSVIFGRAEGATSNAFQQMGPDGSTVIGGSGFGFEHPTTPGTMGMKREKKKRRKKKGVGSMRSKSTTSGGSSAPGASGKSPGYRGQQFPFGGPSTFQLEEQPNHRRHQEEETPMIYLPPPNPSGEKEVTTASPPKKNISRKHAKLAYNASKGWFELDIMGKNGAFVNEEFVLRGTKLIINPKEGTRIQIGGVSFVVFVPEHSEGGPEIGGKGKGKTPSFANQNGNRLKSEMSDGDMAMGLEGSEVAGADSDSVEDGSGEESDQGSDDRGEEEEDEDVEDEEDDDRQGEDVDNSEETGMSEVEEAEVSQSPEPAKIGVKRGRGRPRKDESEARRKEHSAKKAAVERTKSKARDRERRQREKLELQRREREHGKEKEKRRLGIQRQKEERQRQRERSGGKGRKKLHLPVSSKEKREDAKKGKKLYLPTPKSGRGIMAPAHEKRGPGRPPKEKKPSQPQPQPQPQDTTLTSTTTESETVTPPTTAQPQNMANFQYSYNMMPPIDPALTNMASPPAAASKAKKAKKTKPPKKSRSPSPEIDESELPPEALLKPSASYVVLIHEAISTSGQRGLILPDIYKSISRRYPYYRLRAPTTGWQSSVRHNLSQHKAFRKLERRGKGWLWGVVEGVSVGKEKKAVSKSDPRLPNGDGMQMLSNGELVPTGYSMPPRQMYYPGGHPSVIPPPPPRYMAYPPQGETVNQNAAKQPHHSAYPHVPVSSASSGLEHPVAAAPIPLTALAPPGNALGTAGGNPNGNGIHHSMPGTISALQKFIHSETGSTVPGTPELISQAQKVLRGLLSGNLARVGGMDAVNKLVDMMKRRGQQQPALSSPASALSKGKDVASSASPPAAPRHHSSPPPSVAPPPAQPIPPAPATATVAPIPQPPRPVATSIDIKSLSAEEKAVLLKRLLQAKKARESAAAAASNNGAPATGMKRARDEEGEDSAPKRINAGKVES